MLASPRTFGEYWKFLVRHMESAPVCAHMRITIAAIPAVLCLAACSIVSRPVSSSVEARLLRTRMSEADFGAVRSGAGETLHFKLFHGELDSRPVRVPMSKRFRGLPGLEVRLNDRHTVNMLADTGAQLSILDARTVLAARGRVFISPGTDFTVTGIGGSEKAWIARFDHADIGSLRLHAFTTLVRRQKTVSQFAGMGIGGVPINLLGCPVFLGFAFVTFDYPAGEFVFSAGTAFKPSLGARAVPFRVEDQLVYVPLRIGRRVIEAVVDTGAKDEIFLSTTTVRSLGIQARAANGGYYRAAGLGGETSGRQFSLPLAFLDGIPLRDVTVDTADSDAWAARIGSDLLERWRVTFDFRRSVLWFEAPQH